MQKMTEKSIQRILKKTGHQLAVADWADIESLDRLAKKMSGVSETERRLLNSPFELGGLMFYPLTVAKSLWAKEKMEIWDISGTNSDAFMFWVLTIPHGEEALAKYDKRSVADRSMTRLARKMHFSSDDINDVCNKCIGIYDGDSNDTESEEEQAESTSVRYGGMIACLIREYGQSPSYWLHDASIEMIMELYDQLTARTILEDEIQQSKSGVAQAPRKSPKLVALRDYRNKEREIELKWSE